MANYRQLFRNLTSGTGGDFLSPGASKPNSNAAYVADWAEHDNTELIPFSKIPDLAANSTLSATFTAAGATATTALAQYKASFDANAAGSAGITSYTAGQTINAGDALILTVIDTTPDPDTQTVHSFIYVGDSVTADGTNTIDTADFRSISQALAGVQSVSAGAGIQITGPETDGQFFGDITIVSTPTIAPYAIQDTSVARSAVDGEFIVLGEITTATVVTLPTGTPGASIKFANFNTHVSARWALSPQSTERVHGMAVDTDLVIDDNTTSFELIYANATRGWVIVGAN